MRPPFDSRWPFTTDCAERVVELAKTLRLADGFPADGPQRITLESCVPRIRQLIPR